MSELMHKFTDVAEQVPETPYKRAKQEWDNRMGSLVMQAYNWRKMAFILSLLLLILIIALIISNSQPKYIPYIVEVGEFAVTNVAKATSSYQPREAQIKHYLIKFVEKIRSLSVDQEVNKKWLNEAYSFLTPKTANKFDQYFTLDATLNMLKAGHSKTVAVNSFTQVTDNCYQLQWVEETYDSGGVLLTKEKFTGFATIKIVAPTQEPSILQNPLGIWLTDFAWSRVMTDE